MSEILEIACDEAGHTGSDLLQKEQRMFAFSSVAVTDAEAFDIIRKARTDFPVQMPELKASKLLASERGRGLIAQALQALDGRYVVNVNDKLLSLCGWFFEYIYEPVYQDNLRLLYEKNFHRFVAMYTYLWMTDPTSDAKRAIEEFQKYMRSRDPADAPFLFNNPRPPLSEDGIEHPFESILRFAYGYRDIITADNAKLDIILPDQGKWTLDLSASGLWSHLNHWGRTGKLLSVRSDDSKPLKSIAHVFTGDDNDPAIRQARKKHNPEPLGWKLAEPIAFVDSRAHPSIQLADIIAGTAATLLGKGLPGADAIVDSISRHGHPHSILPDMGVIDLSNRSAAVNALIAYDLAKRAERHGDPYENLEAMYHFAEVSWARGDYELIKGRPRKS
ncbi:DUF3800 domain-containing protein [Bradyrhizobium sp. BWA-3-5]|uniref:DUF3800 domain-containing protein n=1 Tax=Bradyrhizobium sp. BWA-3-5 TaxID=3080013 RepID=UPI00293F5449|nr:DUF3800 domain-containing protein [Bradyrhizobium sp. BWA-3-5]WOH68636.1 DUF3800 domain-containing protein [Bradyrhizobium sp. BWA-3-5]